MPVVLVIDDDQSVLLLVEKALQDTGTELVMARSGREGLEAISKDSPDVLLLDISLPDASGLELIGRMRELAPDLPIAFITVSDDSHTAIEAMKLGAYDFLLKPLSVQRVRSVVLRALEMRRLMGARVAIPDLGEIKDESGGHDALIGRSPSMLGIYMEIGRIAKQDVLVLICGESGTGKELVARAIHQHSQSRTFSGGQLRSALRHTARERAVRPRKGSVHGGRSAADRQVRAIERRHHFPG